MPWPLAANLSMLFTELPLLERVAAAARAGFGGVEIQFPYAVPAAQLQSCLDAAGMPLALFNLPTADLMEGGPGLAAVPGREAAFQAALEQALAYAAQARPDSVNVLPGRLAEGVEREAALVVLENNLRTAAEAFAGIGVSVTCEAVNRHDVPGFLLSTSTELAAMLDRVGHPNLSAQLDFYHLARMGEALPTALASLAGRIGHLQFADAPGRGEPGSGDTDFAGAFAELAGQGYDRWLAAEYRPAGPTGDSLGWLAGWEAAGWIRRQGRNL